jgi:hypothetical protein
MRARSWGVYLTGLSLGKLKLPDVMASADSPNGRERKQSL